MPVPAAAYGLNDATWNAQIHRLQDSYGIGKSQLDFNKAVGNTNYNTQLANMKLGHSRSWEPFKSSYGARGLQGSGIAAQGLVNHEGDYQTQLAQMRQNKDLTDFDTSRQSGLLSRSFWSGAQDAVTQRQAAAAELASRLQ